MLDLTSVSGVSWGKKGRIHICQWVDFTVWFQKFKATSKETLNAKMITEGAIYTMIDSNCHNSGFF